VAMSSNVERRVVNPWTWQDAFGFVQANEVTGARRVLVCSGQTSVDADGRPVHVGDMRAQVGQVLDNLETVLREAGFGWSDVVRLNYYTTDVDSFLAAGDLLGQRLAAAGCRPASTLLGVTRLAFPGLLIEIEATAVA
jgi:enamine deaminase RidA (YjgF/YER057c/UK114 family)